MHRKLLWSAIASWVRVLILLVPIILGILYLPPLLRKYRCMFGGAECAPAARTSLEDILKLVPLTPEQREQVKAILK